MNYKTDSLEGTTLGNLTIGKPFRKNDRTYYHVTCACGRTHDMLADNIIRRQPISCKCRGTIIVKNRKYGMLTPIKLLDNGTWECKCDCGRTTFKTPGWLHRHEKNTDINLSCGCKKQANKVKIRADNSTGIKGVCFNKQRGKYIAYINKDGKRYNLGYFDTRELASEARKRAEINLFK